MGFTSILQVFLCFFVGNDFLPHLPSLEIREGAVDRLVNIYKRKIVQLDGWLTDNGVIFADRVKIILQELGRKEDEIFKNRHVSAIWQLCSACMINWLFPEGRCATT